jgi:hypothetical protein
MPFDPQDGFPDDWHVPPSAQGSGLPNDWLVPPSAAPGASQGALSPEPGATASIDGNPSPSPTPQPSFLPPMPASHAGIAALSPSLTSSEFGQFPLQQIWPSALLPLSAGGSPLSSFASPQPPTNAPQFTASSPFGGITAVTPASSDASPYSTLLGGVTAPKPESSDTSPYSKLPGGVVTPKSETSAALSPAPRANSPDATTPFPALDQLGSSPLGPRLLLSALEGGDREDDERGKFKTPEVAAGLIEPGLWSPKQIPRLPSIPPMDGPSAGAEA